MANVAPSLTSSQAAGSLRQSQQAATFARRFGYRTPPRLEDIPRPDLFSTSENTPVSPEAELRYQQQAARRMQLATPDQQLLPRADEPAREQSDASTTDSNEEQTPESFRASKQGQVAQKLEKQVADIQNAKTRLGKARAGVRLLGTLNKDRNIIGRPLRAWLDRIMPELIAGVELVVPALAALGILQIRAIASLPMFRENALFPFFSELRFDDTSILASLKPDSEQMRPPRFTPLTAWVVLLFLYGVMGLLLSIVIVQLLIPIALIYGAFVNPLQGVTLLSSDIVALFKPILQPVLQFLLP